MIRWLAAHKERSRWRGDGDAAKFVVAEGERTTTTHERRVVLRVERPVALDDVHRASQPLEHLRVGGLQR
jgi:hypothetical protein